MPVSQRKESRGPPLHRSMRFAARASDSTSGGDERAAGAPAPPPRLSHDEDIVPADAVLVPPAGVAAAIRTASEATGVDVAYLLKTAACESSFRPDANARNSSAAGLYQFVESTWLAMLKRVGPRFGLDDLADEIVETPTGERHVPDAERRRAILALRHDPRIAATIAGALARKNADFLRRRLGRPPTEGELYIAHFLGPTGGARLIGLALDRPNARASAYFARAARLNRAIFHDGARPRTVAQAYQVLVAKYHDILTGPGSAPAAAMTPPPLVPPPPSRRPPGPSGATLIEVAAPR